MAKQLQIVKAVNFLFPLTTNSVTEVCPDNRTELNRNNHDISIYFELMYLIQSDNQTR